MTGRMQLLPLSPHGHPIFLSYHFSVIKCESMCPEFWQIRLRDRPLIIVGGGGDEVAVLVQLAT